MVQVLTPDSTFSALKLRIITIFFLLRWSLNRAKKKTAWKKRNKLVCNSVALCSECTVLCFPISEKSVVVSFVCLNHKIRMAAPVYGMREFQDIQFNALYSISMCVRDRVKRIEWRVNKLGSNIPRITHRWLLFIRVVSMSQSMSTSQNYTHFMSHSNVSVYYIDIYGMARIRVFVSMYCIW